MPRAARQARHAPIPRAARRALIPRAAGLALLLVLLLSSPAAAVVQRASMAEIEPQLMCTTCGIPLELAVSPQADRERADVQRLIDQGLTTTQIKRALVVQLGPSVLALPPRKGFDLAVYLVPIAVILLLLATFVVGLRRWRRRQRLDPRISSAAPELNRIDAGRLQEDLARFDA
ncbi:MAG TPA: cytochrome c-type biogenesis protein CcmH [Solirubrobacteraceae bacterium]|jgi:cytochrome c-type biogenesis protein CcmH/NrfF|nr:cytochrome c-type biogenesis protein CcmH [Solirubrobacteraceae bacterium]